MELQEGTAAGVRGRRRERMTREEIAKLSEEQIEDMLAEIMEEMCEEDPEPGENRVYHVGEYFFCTANGIQILPDSYEDEDGNEVLYHVVSGLSDREFYTIKPICDKYNIDETYFDGLKDDDGAVSMSVEDIRKQFESEKDWEAVRVLDAISGGIVDDKLPYGSLWEFSEQLSRVRLDYGELYYWYEDQFISLYETVLEEGEPYYCAEEISIAEWLYITNHLDEYRVSYDNPMGAVSGALKL